MAKPIIKQMTPFDASSSKLVQFVWTGAMAYNNRMIVYDASTMLSVYDHTYSSNHYRLDHEIPADTLENGKKYAVQIAVIDKDGNVSEFSDKYYFNVISTPAFYFDGLIASESVDYNQNLIQSQTYKATLIYEQAEKEPIASYQFFLYSSVKELLDSSDVMKNQLKMEYTYRSLESNFNYYLRATGFTQKGIPLDTGYVLITVSYANPSLYARMYATPNEQIGTVDYYSNIVDIESDRPSEEYEFDEGYVDLTQGDPLKTCVISESSPLLPRMTVNYLDLEGTSKRIVTEKDESEITVSSYSEINKITIDGKYEQLTEPIISLNDYVPGSYRYIDTFNITVDGTLIENINDSLPMRSLPIDVHDELVITALGQRYFTRNVGETLITSQLVPVATGMTRNKYGRDMFTAYYDIGATVKYGSVNLVSNALPIATDTSCMVLSQDGSLAIMWDPTEFNITDLDSANAWLDTHTVSVLYPLVNPTTFYLDPVLMPRLINVNSVRYSRNFVIPNNATISVKMKDAFKTCEVLRVQNGEQNTFVLTSMIYDDNTLRYKLQILGPTSDYIIYSDALYFHSWDIVTIHIRRVDGVYGLYVFITEQEADPKRNMWFLTSEPPEEQVERGDIWINQQYPTTYVDKDTVVRFYQDEHPVNAVDQNIWIGE